MSQTLIAVILALLLGHALPGLVRLRRWGWFEAWLAFGRRRLPSLYSGRASILVSLGVPVLVLFALQQLLAGRLLGLAGFGFALGVLLYCWGPRNLDVDVDELVEARDDEARVRALANLADGHDPVRPDDEQAVGGAVVDAALYRWFGVLLWFFVLGPCGALLYRLAERSTGPSGRGAGLAAAHARAGRWLLDVLNWPVAHLMVLALALVGNFDVVHRLWRDWHRERSAGGAGLSSDFLKAVLVASARLHPQEGAAARPWPAAVMALVWRILITWVVAMALFVLAGYV